MRVMDEGCERTKGPNELLADYLLGIRLIFQHYDLPMLEREKLQMAINNVHPKYLDALPKTEYHSFEELENSGDRLKSSKMISKAFGTPPTFRAHLPHFNYWFHPGFSQTPTMPASFGYPPLI